MISAILFKVASSRIRHAAEIYNHHRLGRLVIYDRGSPGITYYVHIEVVNQPSRIIID